MRLFILIVRLWIVALAIAFAITYIMGLYSIYRPLFILMGLTYGITALVEAWVVGLDTGRGKFIVLLSTMGFTAALAVWLGGFFWHLLFRLSILLAVSFMYLNLRFRLHISLGSGKRMIAILLSVIVLILTYMLSAFVEAGTLER